MAPILENMIMAGAGSMTLTPGLVAGLSRRWRLPAAILIIVILPGRAVGQQSVDSFSLIDADADTVIGPLVDGDTLVIPNESPRNFNVRANTTPDTVGSVQFGLDGNSNYRIENVAPYALAGDNGGDYNLWAPPSGDHVVTATPWTESGAGGIAGDMLAVNFYVLHFNYETVTCSAASDTSHVTGDMRQWHAVTVTFDGVCSGEVSILNPFLFYRLNVTFEHPADGVSYTVPGYFAADGNAAESGASHGLMWRAHFTPDRTGLWTYAASFREGTGVAIDSDPNAGAPGELDGMSGSFTVAASNKSGRDFRGRGILRHESGRYLRFSNGEYFLKGGADSPENFLAFADFDSTYNHGGTSYIKTYTDHVNDWTPGDPTWHGVKGKGIIGALNYLASEGMNSVYFLTMNVNGDGKDVWPWPSHTERIRYDVSKLAQWEIVFSHMDSLGIMLHVLTQETENDQLLDGGALGDDRKLYYRELVARFGHHLAITWNLGEENTNTDAQRKAFADFIDSLDVYDHPIVVHTYPGDKDAVYDPLLGYPSFDGPSLQMGSMSGTHSETLKWINDSETAGLPWFVSLDEIGPAGTGVTPDTVSGGSNNHDDVRHYALWGNLMAGGAGVEWYFGYGHPHSDLTAEDWRSRDKMWDYTRYALEFFDEHLPFWEMESDDGLSSDSDAFVFTTAGEVYAVYLPNGGESMLTLPAGMYEIGWFDPRSGGVLQTGTVSTVTGGGAVSIGAPPSGPTEDWVALVTVTKVGLDARILLEGAYAGEGVMHVGPAAQTALPSLQPYGGPEFGSTDLFYAGADSFTVRPDSAVDWVRLSLRAGTDAAGQIGSPRAGLAMIDGRIRDADGTSPVSFSGVDPGNYYVVVGHRNHASVMSSSPVDFTGSIGFWDFTSSAGSAFTTGGPPMKDLGGGIFGMFACDITHDGQITATDFNAWLGDTKGAVTGYNSTDCSLDAQTTAPDFNLWLVNTKEAAASQVP